MPKTVLIVDDVPFVRYPMALALARAGYAVEETADAEAALAYAQRVPVACIVTDLTLPGKSGLELVMEVRGQLVGRTTPIILLVDRPSPSLASYVDAARASWGTRITVLEKPRKADTIAALVETVRAQIA